MGLRLEVYNDNFVGLIADFSFVDDSDYFYSSNNVEDAMEYFNLYVDPKTARLKRNDPNQKIVDNLGLDSANVEDFQTQLKAMTDKLADEDIVDFVLLFAEWDSSKTYNTGDRIRYNGVLYKCLQSHTAQEDWTPTDASSLWAQVLTGPSVSEWVQPDSTNAYMKGDTVIHNGIVYESVIDNNVWEPGVQGTESLWEVVDE